ncbi:tetratricopeptide repeat-containing glycosyltransferase family 2 protein [Metabacillus fastidiosus]|uniref:tetratricopeptide repeat-containing glycosyltransferase family 2 protein n=1 Tax=Metabacillus fastidiosus TaxID=1458 RepID=UPI003D27F825
MRKFTISLCMIVKDEEQYLDKCLQSVTGKVDEIVIVDTGSTDSTKEIAKKYDAKLYELEWKADFSHARNFSIKNATSDYILIMDADEHLDEKEDLQKTLQSKQDYYMVRIKNYLSSGRSILHPAVRLFKNISKLYYYGKIHEHLNIEDPSLNLTFKYADFIIHHDGYKEEVYEDKKKHKRNIKILLEEVESNPDGYNLYNLGNQYRVSDEDEKAVEVYKKAFSLAKDRLYIHSLLYNMVDSLRILQRYEEAINVVDASIESFPNHTDFYFVKGRIYEELGYFYDAENAYKTCLELGEVEFVQTMNGVGSFLASIQLGNLYMEKGQYAKAFDMAIEALLCDRNYLPALRMYIELVEKTKIPYKQIKEHLAGIYPIETIDDLKNLIVILTVTKSPLLHEYITLYKLDVDQSVLAIASLYVKKYKDAQIIWDNMENIESSQVNDVLLLSYLLNDDGLLLKCRRVVNISDKEWKVLKRILLKSQTVNVQISETIESILLFMLERLYYLNEEEHVLYIIETLSKSEKTKYNLAKLLNEMNLVDLSQQILLEMYEANLTSLEVNELLGDTCIKRKQYIESLSFYNRSLELKNKYKIYEKVYDIYKEANDQEGMDLIRQEIKKQFPMAKWILNK